MKNLIKIIGITLAFFLICSCSHNKKQKDVKNFVNNIVTIDPEEVSGSQPISKLSAVAEQKANKTIALNKENIGQALEEAKSYNKALIVVGTHTLIKIKDFDDCKKSTAWGTCMPKGVALIQKSGNFEKKTDYINNLIGLPDGQERKMFLFK